MADFSSAALAKSVHDTLDEAYTAIPDGKSHALLVDGSVGTGGKPAARLLYAQRIGDGWQIALEGQVQQGAKPAGKVALLKAW